MIFTIFLLAAALNSDADSPAMDKPKLTIVQNSYRCRSIALHATTTLAGPADRSDTPGVAQKITISNPRRGLTEKNL